MAITAFNLREEQQKLLAGEKTKVPVILLVHDLLEQYPKEQKKFARAFGIE